MCNKVWCICQGFEAPMEIIKNDLVFNVQQNKVVCNFDDFFQANGMLYLMVWIFFLIYLEWNIISMYNSDL